MSLKPISWQDLGALLQEEVQLLQAVYALSIQEQQTLIARPAAEILELCEQKEALLRQLHRTSGRRQAAMESALPNSPDSPHPMNRHTPPEITQYVHHSRELASKIFQVNQQNAQKIRDLLGIIQGVASLLQTQMTPGLCYGARGAINPMDASGQVLSSQA